MRSLLDFSSWHALGSTLIGLLLATLLMVGVRLLFMQTLQRRRERENRQINERLKTLIAAYKTLGGSFTGSLQVHPTHVRDLSRATPAETQVLEPTPATAESTQPPEADDTEQAPLGSSERQRRIRDAVEAALSDVILLGTPEQVTLAAAAARDMVAGRSIETGELVVSLRSFIRTALGLEPIGSDVVIPLQGPLRPSVAGGGGAGARNAGARGEAGNAQRGGGAGGGGGGAGAAAGGGMGGMMLGGSMARSADDAGPPTP
jgi:type II secretory pathway pseudopilin PulG